MISTRLRRLRKGRVGTVEFCDACGSVCDGRCRSEAIREASRTKGLLGELRRI